MLDFSGILSYCCLKQSRDHLVCLVSPASMSLFLMKHNTESVHNLSVKFLFGINFL